VKYAVQIQCKGCRKLLTNGQHPLDFRADSILQLIYIKLNHRANNHYKYTDVLYNCIIDHNDGHIPSPLIMFSSTALHHALLQWQKVFIPGPREPPAVWVWNRKTVRFSSRTAQNPDRLLLDGPNPAPYLSTLAFCQILLGPSGPISGSAFQVVLFMVTFRYPTVNCQILTMVLHCHFLMY